VPLRVIQVLRVDAGEARLIGHRFERDSQNLRHATVAEQSLALRINDPNTFGHRLDHPAVHIFIEAHEQNRTHKRSKASSPLWQANIR
jgi:hypothetical protein